MTCRILNDLKGQCISMEAVQLLIANEIISNKNLGNIRQAMVEQNN